MSLKKGKKGMKSIITAMTITSVPTHGALPALPREDINVALMIFPVLRFSVVRLKINSFASRVPAIVIMWVEAEVKTTLKYNKSCKLIKLIKIETTPADIYLSAGQFKPSALSYLAKINGAQGPYDLKIAESLILGIQNSGIRELPKIDFELLVNQFFNHLHFGPVTNMELFLTEGCNLSCDYCFVRGKSPKTMSWENIVSAINFLVLYSGDENLLNLTLFGGEPLLEKKNIYKIVELCGKLKTNSGKKDFAISITTNGTLITETLLKRTQGKINYLLSIDGNEETHDRYRKFNNGKGSFKKTVSKIGLLKKYQPWLGARMTILPGSVHHLSDNVAYLSSLGINQLLLGLAMDSTWDKKALETYEKQLMKVGEFYIGKRQSADPLRITLFERDEKGINCHEHEWGCGAGRNTVSVNTDGDIYPCSKFVGYESFDCMEMKLGNIYEGITNIPLRVKMSQITNDAFPGCSRCKEINACMGGCPADNYYLNKDIYKPGQAHCDLKKIENRVLRKLAPRLENI